MRQSVVLLSASTLLVLGLGAAPSASAAIKCRHNPNTHVLSVTLTGEGPLLGEAVVHRAGAQIRVSAFLGARIACHGDPSVTNTGQIKLHVGDTSEVTI